MGNGDPLETVSQLRVWVERKLSSLGSDSVRTATVRKKYRKINGVIDQLESLGIPISEEIILEKETLEEVLRNSNEREVLNSLATELSNLAKDIRSQLRDSQSLGTIKRKRAPAKRLRVRFPNGTVISESNATTTFLRSLQSFGLARVAELRSVRAQGHSLVSKMKHEPSNSIRELDGYFIETKLSTKDKARYLRRIADALQVDVTVEVLD